MERRPEILWFGFFVAALITGSQALRGHRINVPAAVIRGENALLECFYDLEGDQLYSVKWYWKDTEFYRYTPKEIPPVKQFRNYLGGPVVLERESDGTKVVLEKVSRSISGRYTCEVTADQPSFFTEVQSAPLQVVDLPAKDPYISGLKTRYRQGEVLKANCTSEDSNPAANLTWYANGAPVEHVHVYKHRSKPSTDAHLYTAHSTLRLQITKQLHSKGRLKIRCVASMYNVYYRSTEKSVELERKRHRHLHVATTTSTTELPYVQWEPAQAAETHPETTLVFFASSGCSFSSMRLAALPIVLFILLR